MKRIFAPVAFLISLTIGFASTDFALAKTRSSSVATNQIKDCLGIQRDVQSDASISDAEFSVTVNVSEKKFVFKGSGQVKEGDKSKGLSWEINPDKCTVVVKRPNKNQTTDPTISEVPYAALGPLGKGFETANAGNGSGCCYYAGLTVTTLDPPGYWLARTSRRTWWNSYGQITSGYYWCDAANPTPPPWNTHWYVQWCTGSTYSHPSSVTAQHYNYDFINPSLPTYAYHRIYISPTPSYGSYSYSWEASHWGEVSYLLRGQVSFN